MQPVEEIQKLLSNRGLVLAVYDRKHDKPIYVQPAYIIQHYSMSATTVTRRMREMKQISKYKDSFIDGGERKPLVKLVDFEKFLNERGN